MRFVTHKWVLIVLLTQCAALAEPQTSGPSFNCVYAHTNVEKLICGDAKLAALDSDLAVVFNGFSHQAGNDTAALRKEEDRWLAAKRNICTTKECLVAAYESRIAELRDRSLREASPAAYAETRPFPISAATWSAAQALLGKTCQRPAGGGLPIVEGFTVDPAMPMGVIFQGGVVVVRQRDGERVAFYIAVGDPSDGLLRDELSIPASGPKKSAADRLLFCSLPDMQSSGFGIRLAGEKRVAGYWEVDTKAGKMTRQPLGVLGAEESIRCSQPEEPEP